MGANFLHTVEALLPLGYRFAEFHAGVKQETHKSLDEVCGGGLLSCRFTHVYPD